MNLCPPAKVLRRVIEHFLAIREAGRRKKIRSFKGEARMEIVGCACLMVDRTLLLESRFARFVGLRRRPKTIAADAPALQ
jgi:hypothetical protein